VIANNPNDERNERCGHGFVPAECPYMYCGFRACGQELDKKRQSLDKITEDRERLSKENKLLRDGLSRLREFVDEDLGRL
jgi:hypothetical protein